MEDGAQSTLNIGQSLGLVFEYATWTCLTAVRCHRQQVSGLPEGFRLAGFGDVRKLMEAWGGELRLR